LRACLKAEDDQKTNGIARGRRFAKLPGTMTRRAPRWRQVWPLLLALAFAGCSPIKRSGLDDERDPHVLEAQKRVRGSDWDGAVQSFERALQSNPNNATAHLELGIIYDQRKNDYGSAIYHYQRHLRLRTNSPMAEVVNQNILGCKRELAKTVSYAIVTRDAQRDLEAMAQAKGELQKRVQELEADLARRPLYVTNYVTNFLALPEFGARDPRLTRPTRTVEAPAPLDESPVEPAPAPARNPDPPRAAKPTAQKNPAAPAAAASRPPAAVPAARAIRTVHTVRPGETLAALASKYGVPLKDLRAANPAAAKGVRSGQKINIPAK